MRLHERVWLLPGGAAATRVARAEMPQKNDLCGAFVALVALRAHGIRVTDQDEAALPAGTMLMAGGEPTWPEGESGRADYRVRLPETAEIHAAGTTPAGVRKAVEQLSGGPLAVVPASGAWTERALGTLLAGCAELPSCTVIANVFTGAFGAHDTPERALADTMDTGMLPMWSSRWRMPHFVLLTGSIRGARATLVSVVDTYPSLGSRGVHLQPAARLVAALRRDGMSPGGILIVVPDDAESAARSAVEQAGLRRSMWGD